MTLNILLYDNWPFRFSLLWIIIQILYSFLISVFLFLMIWIFCVLSNYFCHLYYKCFPSVFISCLYGVLCCGRAFQMVQWVKNPIQCRRCRSDQGSRRSLEEGHVNPQDFFALKGIPWTEEPSGLQFAESDTKQRAHTHSALKILCM